MVYGRRFSHLFLWGVSANELPWKVINDSPFIRTFSIIWKLFDNYFAIICFVFFTWYTLYGIYICWNWNKVLFLHNVSFFEFFFIHITIVDFPILTFFTVSFCMIAKKSIISLIFHSYSYEILSYFFNHNGHIFSFFYRRKMWMEKIAKSKKERAFCDY